MPVEQSQTFQVIKITVLHIEMCIRDSYGGAITLEAETYLSDRLVLLLRLRERILWGSASTHAHFQYGSIIIKESPMHLQRCVQHNGNHKKSTMKI